MNYRGEYINIIIWNKWNRVVHTILEVFCIYHKISSGRPFYSIYSIYLLYLFYLSIISYLSYLSISLTLTQEKSQACTWTAVWYPTTWGKGVPRGTPEPRIDAGRCSWSTSETPAHPENVRTDPTSMSGLCARWSDWRVCVRTDTTTTCYRPSGWEYLRQ